MSSPIRSPTTIPGSTRAIDWDATIAFRRHLWSLGLGVAEAMDTAQRGMGLDWPTSLELIRRSLDAAKDLPGALIACGAGTDHLEPSAERDDRRRHPRLRGAMRGDREARRPHHPDGEPRAGARRRAAADDYANVYGRILSQVKAAGDHPLARRDVRSGARRLLGHRDHREAMEVAVDVIAANAAKVDGIKISLLDKDKEIAMRRRLPQGVRMYTGDDFNYAELIAGDEQGYSDALLGIFDAIAPAASAALGALAPRRHARRSTTSWRRPCRCRATSSRRRRASTRPASCSWPISTACRTISPWSAARRARARRCISPSCSGSPTPPGLLPIRIAPPRACAS